MAVLAGIVSLVNAALSQGTTDRTRNAEVLQHAKTALIGYVAKEVLDLTNANPGRLPCPESPGVAGIPNNEGIAASSCAPTFPVQKTVGRLPWRTLGLDKLVDAHAEPLWYAVSMNWVLDGGSPPVINAGTVGQLNVDSIPGVVAVIIAPGAPLTLAPNPAQIAHGCDARAQRRNDRSHVATSGVDPDYRDYLECRNAANPVGTSFGSSVPDNATNAVLNDQIVYITASDILNAIQGPLAERMQKTVAPLLSEHRDKWIASGARFLPYAVSFDAPPETNADTCGTAGEREGLLPTALTTTPGCTGSWNNFGFSGSGNSAVFVNCTGSVSCQFRYYRLNSLGGVLDFLLNLLGLSHLVGNVGGSGTITATITADAPSAALTFRDPLASSDVSVSGLAGGSTYLTSIALTPKATGEISLALQVTISSAANNMCTSLIGLVCDTLPGLLATPFLVTVDFPQLRDATVEGTQLSAGVLATPTNMSLLNPAPVDPHYWFIANEWHRYAHYTVAPIVSAARTAGLLTVNGFPPANGNANDKHFVLALMGPAVAGQTSRPSASVTQYLEGDNASLGDDAFAHHVFAQSGNDRIVACPFSTGGTPVCN
jgi:hypothetical protein